jgi:hypothetical protein
MLFPATTHDSEKEISRALETRDAAPSDILMRK